MTNSTLLFSLLLHISIRVLTLWKQSTAKGLQFYDRHLLRLFSHRRCTTLVIHVFSLSLYFSRSLSLLSSSNHSVFDKFSPWTLLLHLLLCSLSDILIKFEVHFEILAR